MAESQILGILKLNHQLLFLKTDSEFLFVYLPTETEGVLAGITQGNETHEEIRINQKPDAD